MNWLDLILIVPIIWLGFKGFKKGLILEIFTLLALIAGIYGGIHFSSFAADFLTEDMKFSSEYMPLIAFAVTFIAIVVGVYYLGKILEKVIKMVALNIVNKILGAAFGIVKALLFLSLFLILVEGIDRKAQLIPNNLKTESALYLPILKLTGTLFPVFEDGRLFKQLEDKWNPLEELQDVISDL